ncbi:MAG: redox-sensing transcriptional repressor Rex, partial [Lachnospiraceae bacterium]|nr:redox-sensing transcriptional repressor Rex [Lachnospiraceae bacterium]
MEKEISQAVVRRMPRYYRYLGELLDDGVERISSNELSTRMRVTASQIRQDLNNFGGFGQQGYGYNVKYLYDEIGKILGINHQHNIIVVGAGNLGQALANYIKFEKRGFVIIGLFDVNPALRGIAVRGIKIRTMDELKDFLAENQVDIAALTLPKEKADEVANMLVNLGINAIWNFAHL